MGDLVYNHFFYYYLHLKNGVTPKRLDLKNPTTFNEKTIWMKMYHRYKDAHVLADKILVKEFVKEKVGEEYIIPNITIYDDASNINLDALPSSFVMKANHGSGWNIICPDKEALDLPKVRTQLTRWLKTNYSDIGKEYQYRDIVPKILCEQYLESSKDEPLIDYKIFCFSGEPTYIQVDLDRLTNHTRNFYDLDWNLLPFTTLYPLGKRQLAKPEKLEEMLSIARVLSAGLKFARIDLYFHRKSIYFGEITFHHGGGFEPFTPPEYDGILGGLLDIIGCRPA